VEIAVHIKKFMNEEDRPSIPIICDALTYFCNVRVRMQLRRGEIFNIFRYARRDWHSGAAKSAPAECRAADNILFANCAWGVQRRHRKARRSPIVFVFALGRLGASSSQCG
jgi:hypothetical protein